MAAEELERCLQICSYADQLLAAINMAAIAAHGELTVSLGAEAGAMVGVRRLDPDDIAAKKEAKELDAQKTAMVGALKSKCLALGRCLEIVSTAAPGSPAGAELESAFKADAIKRETLLEETKETQKQLEQWEDLSDKKNAEVASVLNESKGRFGLALKALDTHINEEKSPSQVGSPKKPQPPASSNADSALQALYDRRATLLAKLDWDFWEEHEKTLGKLRDLKSYSLF